MPRSTRTVARAAAASVLLLALLGRAPAADEPKEDAVAAARRALEESDRLARERGPGETAGARDRYVELLDAGLVAAAAARDAENVCLFIEKGRAGGLVRAMAGREAIRGARVPPDVLEAEASARRNLAAAWRIYQDARSHRDRVALRDGKAAMELASAGLVDSVERVDREARAAAGVWWPKPATLDAIRAGLGSRDALVLYATHPSEAVALVVTPRTARTVSLGPREELETACEECGWDQWDVEPVDAVERLRRLLADPLGLPHDVDRVLVSPDGALWAVPFSLLLPLREVAYVPSATAYLLLRERAAGKGTGVIAVGNPEVIGGFNTGRLPPLPTTAQEAREIGDPALIGADATLVRLKQALASRPRWRAVHIATHSLLDAERPGLSALGFTATETDDGLWMALDIARSTWESDLVVLSAVRTAVGPDLPGEGPMSLARAFLAAGVPRVVASLENVDDAATVVLMRRLHESWKAGTPAATALKEAQLHVRSHPKWRHPTFWASWILLGVPD